MIFTKAFKIGGSEVTVSSSCVGSHCLTLLRRFGEARLRRERQARSDVLSLWVTYLPQRSSSVALGTVFVRACGLTTPHTAQLVGGAHLRQLCVCVSRLVTTVCILCTRSLVRLIFLDILLRHNALVGGHPGPRKKADEHSSTR